MFKQSTFYRTDIVMGRYVGHPVTAATHLFAGILLAVSIYLGSLQTLNPWAWLFLLAPGVWLGMTTMFFMMWATARTFGMPETASAASRGDGSLKENILSRETLSFLVVLLIVAAAVLH